MEVQEFLQNFENNKYKVRVIFINREAWFVARDVAISLEYKSPKDAVSDNVDTEDQMILTAKQLQQMASESKIDFFTTLEINSPRGLKLINESGLYSLILRSHLPEAKKFKHWVTSEVLPSIRKYGYYVNPAAPKEFFSPFQKYNELKFLIENCTDLKLRDNLIKAAFCLLI